MGLSFMILEESMLQKMKSEEENKNLKYTNNSKKEKSTCYLC